jgi:S1-C subfamily serine protease
VRHARALVVGLVLCVVSGLALLDAGAESVDAPSSAGTAPTSASPAEAVEALGATESRAVPAVQVMALGCGWSSWGSGVLLPGGRVLTAAHVLDGAERATIEIDGVTAEATVAALDGNGRDVALLDAPALAGIAGAAVDETGAEQHATVRVIGHPFGGPRADRTGAVVGWLDAGPLALDGGRVLTLDVVVDEGMSGGPVVDANGAVVGVAIGYESNTRTGIAVPIDELDALLDGIGATAPEQQAC